MRRSRFPIRHLLEREAKKHGVRVMKFANVGNHLHLVVHAKSRLLLPRFMRAFAGLVARQSSELKGRSAVLRTHEDGTRERFWDERPFSRIMEWGDLVRPEGIIARLARVRAGPLSD